MTKFVKDIGTIEKRNAIEVIFQNLNSNEFVTCFQTFLCGEEISTLIQLKSKNECFHCGRTYSIYSHIEFLSSLKNNFKEIIDLASPFQSFEGSITINSEIAGEYESFCYKLNFIVE